MAPQDMARVVAFWMPVFRFVQSAISAGSGVIVHCRAGCHRAGTVAVAIVMMLCQWSLAEAL
eukprot:9509050-Prorocentrum_lima.AAC.1